MTRVDQADFAIDGVRVLFAFGVSQEFLSLPSDRYPAIQQALKQAFANLDERFGVQVLGTLDDDETMVGPTVTWPFTGYILAEAPDREAVSAVCTQLRDVKVGTEHLWKFVKVEARIGRALFFGEKG